MIVIIIIILLPSLQKKIVPQKTQISQKKKKLQSVGLDDVPNAAVYIKS